jgi:hypothetical protein
LLTVSVSAVCDESGMTDLDELLSRFPADIVMLTRQLLDWLGAERPDLTAKVRLGWGSVNFHHPRAGFVVAVFPFRDHVSLIFQNGRLLDSPLLVGETKQVRWIPMRPGEPIAFDDIGLLLVEAIALVG